MRTRMMSAFALGSVLVATGAPIVSASPDATSVFHFRGRAASAILTDCIGVPVGGTCRAIDVFAFEQRVNDDGERSGGPGVDVIVYDVSIVEGGFVEVPVAVGFTEDASVRIDHNLSSGSASAADIPLQPSGHVSVDVTWTGQGPTTRSRGHDMFANSDFFINERSAGTFRGADAAGALDGMPVDDIPLFPSSLQSDSYGSVFRVPRQALGASIALAAGHTSERSASGGMTDCPDAGSPGTACHAVFVSVSASETETSVFADFYDVTLDPAGEPVLEFTGFGTDEDPTASFTPHLGGLTVVADLERFDCAVDPCTPTGSTTNLEARWEPIGSAEHFRQRSQFRVDGSFFHFVGNGRVRPAAMSGTVDGADYRPGFGASLRELSVHVNSN